MSRLKAFAKEAAFQAGRKYPGISGEPARVFDCDIEEIAELAFLRGAGWQVEEDIRLCEQERQRQLDGGREYRLSGADTAFALAKTLRAVHDEDTNG